MWIIISFERTVGSTRSIQTGDVLLIFFFGKNDPLDEPKMNPSPILEVAKFVKISYFRVYFFQPEIICILPRLFGVLE